MLVNNAGIEISEDLITEVKPDDIRKMCEVE